MNRELENCRKRATEAESAKNDSMGHATSSVRSSLDSTASGVMASSVGSGKPQSPDDLTKIEGIGKKIQEHLNSGSIWSFTQLSETSVSRLQDILDAAGPAYTMHDPGTWPEQAQLAKDGKWDELSKWQAELKGGRKRKKR